MKMPGGGKSKAAMQADRHCVIRVDAGNHHVFAHAGGSRQELRHQRPPYALAAAIRAHVNAVLDTVPISRPCPKFAEGPEPGDARGIPGDD